MIINIKRQNWKYIVLYTYKITCTFFILSIINICVAQSTTPYDIKNSVVSVQKIVNNKAIQSKAFYIGDGKFVTNFHIIKTKSKKLLQNLSINTLNAHEANFFIKKIIHLDAVNDLAVVQVSPQDIPILDQILIPLEIYNSTSLITDLKNTPLFIPDYHNNLMPVLFYELIISTQQLKFKASKLTVGMSGSPILLNNKVVGILYGKSGIIGMATHSGSLLKLLKQKSLNCIDITCITQEMNNLKIKALHGNFHAQYKLGLFYYANKDLVGIFGSYQYIKAKYWFSKAAKQGHLQAIDSMKVINNN